MTHPETQHRRPRLIRSPHSLKIAKVRQQYPVSLSRYIAAITSLPPRLTRPPSPTLCADQKPPAGLPSISRTNIKLLPHAVLSCDNSRCSGAHTNVIAQLSPAIHRSIRGRHGHLRPAARARHRLWHGSKAEELTAYYGVAPSILEGVIDQWLQRTARCTPSSDTRPVLDVGAGKGVALLLASQFPFAAVEGVELNCSLARIAQSNIDLWLPTQGSPLAPITLHHADATTHTLPTTPTLAFLFHPFESCPEAFPQAHRSASRSHLTLST